MQIPYFVNYGTLECWKRMIMHIFSFVISASWLPISYNLCKEKNPSVKKYKKGKWFTIFIKIKYAKEVPLKINVSWEPIFSHYFRPFKLLGGLYK